MKIHFDTDIMKRQIESNNRKVYRLLDVHQML